MILNVDGYRILTQSLSNVYVVQLDDRIANNRCTNFNFSLDSIYFKLYPLKIDEVYMD